MSLDVPLTLRPMEAEPVDDLPRGRQWLFEPKYDGFRCLAFRDGEAVRLLSRNQKPLNRYFPEVVEGLRALAMDHFFLDGELVIRDQPFETLQLRLHPAASRVAMLAMEFPATLLVFDLLAGADGSSLLEQPFAERRAALEDFMRRIGRSDVLLLSRTTRSRPTALGWLGSAGLDGVVAKRLDLAYRPGERAMRKYKLWHTIDCVVGGYYEKGGTDRVESLLLGLYDDEGRLNYVGRSAVHEHTAEIGEMLRPLVGGTGFTGRAPGGKSRWSSRERRPVSLRPTLVVEVSADHITGSHMRHGARLLRWRDDKRPQDCTMDQLEKVSADRKPRPDVVVI